MFYVYVLKSRRNGRLYVGQTCDIDRRIIEHNSGRSQATKYQGPYDLVHVETFHSRSEAMTREYFLKTGQGREELKNLGLYIEKK